MENCLTLDEKKTIQEFIQAGYQIEFFEEKTVYVEGEFDPLVWHHYKPNTSTEIKERFYYITNRWDDEGKLVVNKTFKTTEDVLKYIFKNIQVFEGVK